MTHESDPVGEIAKHTNPYDLEAVRELQRIIEAGEQKRAKRINPYDLGEVKELQRRIEEER